MLRCRLRRRWGCRRSFYLAFGLLGRTHRWRASVAFKGHASVCCGQRAFVRSVGRQRGALPLFARVRVLLVGLLGRALLKNASASELARCQCVCVCKAGWHRVRSAKSQETKWLGGPGILNPPIHIEARRSASVMSAPQENVAHRSNAAPLGWGEPWHAPRIQVVCICAVAFECTKVAKASEGFVRVWVLHKDGRRGAMNERMHSDVERFAFWQAGF